jgi:hypothetical protein
MAKKPQSGWYGKPANQTPCKSGKTAPARGQYAERSTRRGVSLPPEGPSNIIVRTANPLPAPKTVDSQ